MLKRILGLLGWLGVALVFAAVAIRFLKPEWQQYYNGLAIAGLVCTLLYILSQWREIGQAFVAQTNAMAAAVDAKDPDAAMRAGGRWAAIVFADKSYDGKPIAKEARQKKLWVQSQRMLRDVKVSGGYQLGDDAVLTFGARNGSGWVERGAVLVSHEGGTWDVAGKQTVAYPQ